MRWLSAAVLVAVNIVPLIGVAFWGWSLMLILVLYWIESGIVGMSTSSRTSARDPALDGPPANLIGD